MCDFNKLNLLSVLAAFMMSNFLDTVPPRAAFSAQPCEAKGLKISQSKRRKLRDRKATIRRAICESTRLVSQPGFPILASVQDSPSCLCNLKDCHGSDKLSIEQRLQNIEDLLFWISRRFDGNLCVTCQNWVGPWEPLNQQANFSFNAFAHEFIPREHASATKLQRWYRSIKKTKHNLCYSRAVFRGACFNHGGRVSI